MLTRVSGSSSRLSFVVVAIAFKFGAVPFHMWVPDVYQGAPASSAMLVATVPKLASFAMAFRFLSEGLAAQTADWTQMLAILAVLSVVAGNLIAIAQTSLLRMLAYSAIANVGFILLGFAAGTGGRVQRSAVLHAGLCADDGGRLCRDPDRRAAVAARRISSNTTRACTRAIRCWPA